MKRLLHILLILGASALTAGAETNLALLRDASLITPDAPAATATNSDQAKLDLARHLRDQGDFDQAEKSLVSIVESDAPEEMQRAALLELATTAEQHGNFATAQQVLAQFVQHYPDNPDLPEIMLRQGLLYRQMGAYTMALAKFYAVMTTVLNLRLDSSGHYQRLVLRAQTEIADTYYMQARYREATEFFERLLKLDSPELDKTEIRLKFLRCLDGAKRHEDVVREAENVLSERGGDEQKPEARFLLTTSLQQLGRKPEALRQALLLVQSTPKDGVWRRRIGNEVANTFYADGDFTNALTVYLSLAQADTTPQWQLPLLYQVALTYEHLRQPDRASEGYGLIVERGKQLGGDVDPALQMVLDMAGWRNNYLAWQSQAAQVMQTSTQLR
jgi:tetratricopeptide (TPR) repeat protein